MDAHKNAIRVLIVDDCPIVREFIIGLLAEEADIKVVGEAANGEEASKQAFLLRPNLIIMDIAMPVMDGLEAIEVIMQNNPTPILVVTAYGDAHLAYEAVSRGALEVVEKPSIDSTNYRQFIHKIKLLAGVKVIRHITGNRQAAPKHIIAKAGANRRSKAVAIASSLGGAKVLEAILSQLSADFPAPIVIAQHISEGFAEALADWLDYKTPLTVKVASQSEPLLPGRVLIAPPEHNVQLDVDGNIELLPYSPGNIYHPSCDRLLASVAHAYRKGAVGIILTGMGQDGVKGMQAIKAAGGITIAQNKQTSLIYNMPRLVIEAGLADFIVAEKDIASTLTKVLTL
ncbi:chemotaxis-specific protein-glutamate methyltransferase CheB [Sporomusa sp. KB1]|jgi:two-component system chemotaxis response regulator CheB|uniref:chemotaxis-specific protein-glutamate methyltransferase CheB n=1 Tax=Sporomusa sp. KB1 TaxID=943346 RepID=UPI0011A6B896|nr:chemotaxis-specific protein-glutamate methyltransferase CheB [Sporomusa sp. KB1]TWH45465.1 two-component system chemotaxis response regulator CheB [Sporomusa sp. KB1]